ncbi:hypothetical protein EV356DRAFT_496622 [Viridothelium virens]|uniref:Uncharacterized protein n=1 Tax=Viridothelium virens TaxID=1048519 RepID=A0A6A6GTS9_VIRVR|nr:hypothetical protein EV356DRAFT_496622 [Viridothelium virens]
MAFFSRDASQIPTLRLAAFFAGFYAGSNRDSTSKLNLELAKVPGKCSKIMQSGEAAYANLSLSVLAHISGA